MLEIPKNSWDTLDTLNKRFNSHVSMRVKDARRGHAHYSQEQWFTLPIFVLTKGAYYRTYYVIHEFTHCLLKQGHGKEFEDMETYILQLFGLQVTYAKVYPLMIWHDGKAVYIR